MEYIDVVGYLGEFAGVLFLYFIISRAILMKVKKPKSFIIAAVIYIGLYTIINIPEIINIIRVDIFAIIICAIDCSIYDARKSQNEETL